jgi:hypothetical protein
MQVTSTSVNLKWEVPTYPLPQPEPPKYQRM